MSWRTVIISNRCKLDLKMGYMVVRGETIRRIFLDEIAMVIIENPAVSLTGCLLEALVQKKIRVIFCDSRRSPAAELAPYYGSHDCSRKLRMQMNWAEEAKGWIWSAIVGEKLRQQRNLLAEQGHDRETALLEGYIPQIEFQDQTNREGHAAKVYFNALFGMQFTREQESPINAALDYGYGILLSAFNREITACGYLTQLELHHENVFNQFNLSSDLMEPFRPLVDRIVIKNPAETFGKDERYRLVDVLNQPVIIRGKQQMVLNAIGIYVRSVFDALERNDPMMIHFYDL